MKTKIILFLLIILIISGWLNNNRVPAQPSSTPADRATAVELSQDVENWFYPHYENNRLVWEGKGQKAHLTGETEVTAEKFQLLYHYQSRPEGATVGEELIRFQADYGVINRPNNEAIFRKDVRVQTESTAGGDNQPEIQSASTELKTQELFMNLTTQLISSTLQAVLSQPDLIITGTGLTADINIGRVNFHRQVLTFIEGTNLSSFSLYPVIVEVPAEQKKTSKITVSCAGPLNFEKLAPAADGSSRQKIQFNNEVALVKQTAADILSTETKLYAGELEIILINQPAAAGNDISKTELVLSHFTARGNVHIEDGTTNAFSHQVDWDEATQRVTFWGQDERLARITRDTLKTGPPDDPEAKPEPAITLQAREIENITADDIFILKGKKEAIFFNQETEPASGGSRESPPSSNGGTEPTNKIHVTAKNNAIISLKTGRAVFKNQVRVIQKNENSTDKTGVVEPESTMKADRLIMTLDKQRNEIRNTTAWGNILITNKDGSRIVGKIFEWEPSQNFFKVKSDYLVKAWHQDHLIKSNEVIVHTVSKAGGQFGNWSQIEAKNKNGAAGIIEIHHQPKEK